MLTTTRHLHLTTESRGRKRVTLTNKAPSNPPNGLTPRISRLMALAIRFEQLIAEGTVTDQSDLARLAHVSQPRITQIMNLLHLAPDIQESLLFLPPTTTGKPTITEKTLRPITNQINWNRQREMWK